MKKVKYSFSVRSLSMLISLIMVVLCFPAIALETEEVDTDQANAPVEASDNVEVEEVEDEFIPWSFTLEEGDLDIVALKTAELPESDRPEIISADLVTAKKHVNRLYAQEPDEFTIMFQNRDGSKTTYIFSCPVKAPLPGGGYEDMPIARIQAVAASVNSGAGQSTASAVTLAAGAEGILINIGNGSIRTRFGNESSDRAIMSCNIGEFLVYKTNTSAIAGGISSAAYDVTAEARAWAEPNTNGDGFLFVPEECETDQMDADDNASLVGPIVGITPGDGAELIAVAYTASDLAGEFIIRSYSDLNLISCNVSGGVSMYPRNQDMILPECAWFFQYVADGQYHIKPMARQDRYLCSYDDYVMTVDEDESISFEWEVVSYNNTQWRLTVSGKHLSPDIEMIQALPEGPPLWELSRVTTSTTFLTSISMSQTVITAGINETVSPTITKSPQNASYTTSNAFVYTISNNQTLTSLAFSTAGVYTVTCKYKYNPSVKTTFKVIVSEPYTINSGFTYLIRQYEDTIDADTKLLTLNTTSNALSLSSWSSIWYINGSRTVYLWENTSQAFTITSVGDNLYKITAILSTAQYGANYYVSYTTSYTGNYVLPDKAEKPNTLTMSDNMLIQTAAYDGENNQKWYIYRSGNQFYFENAAYPGYKLTYDSSEGISVSTSTANNAWYINCLGMDVPCIKQTTSYYCGIASPVQVLYYKNVDAIVNSNMSIANLLQYIDTNYYMSITAQGAGILQIRSFLNRQNMLGASTYTCDFKQNINFFRTKIKDSIESGYPVIVKVSLSDLPYCTVEGVHYICISGYDEKTDRVIISDCSYVPGAQLDCFGIRIITMQELYDATGGYEGHLVYYNAN